MDRVAIRKVSTLLEKFRFQIISNLKIPLLTPDVEPAEFVGIGFRMVTK